MKKFLLSLFILAFMLAGTAYSQRIGGENPNLQPGSWGILGIIQSAGDTTFNATQTVNWATGGNVQKITLTGSISSISFSGWVPGGVYALKLVQGGAGGFTVAFPDSSYPTWQWVGGAKPTLSAAPNTADWIIFRVDADGYITAGATLNAY